MIAAAGSSLLAEKLDNLPKSPGVYLFKDPRGKVIYIGKAKVLRNRVRSYFNKGEDGRYQYQRLVNSIADLEVIITGSEIEALVLEANLVKKNTPRYNVQLRDDKSYPYLRITNETFPRVFLVRKTPRDGSKYYGPYTDVKPMRRFLRTFKGVLKIRNCNRVITAELIDSRKYRPCLNYHIGRCAGACSGKISSEAYKRNVRLLVNLINGRDTELVAYLQGEMSNASEEQRYEEAAQWRDRLQQVENLRQQSAVRGLESVDLTDRDVISLATEDDDGCAVVFQIRAGRIIGRSHFYLSHIFEKTQPEVLEAFLKEYYQRTESIPEEIFLPCEVEDVEVIARWIGGKRQKRVALETPKIGDKARLVRLVTQNAELLLGELKLQKSKKDFIHHALKSLQRDLLLQKPPRIIEAFDISNLQGGDAVASMVCFKDAKPARSEYRRFKIKTVGGADDFAMMGEVIRRRYQRSLKEQQPLPDLILVDGGKGQLNREISILSDLGLKNIPAIGLAKKLEEVFLPGHSDPQNIPKNSSSLKLLCQVRDEAHRFAVTYHRNLRKKRMTVSELDSIPGVGANRKKTLMKRFGSVKNLKVAEQSDIAATPGISASLAKDIYERLHR